MSAEDAPSAAAAGSGDGPSDEMVSQFLAFTGSADPSNAVSYLEMSGGDLETAVGLYLEHQGGGGGGGIGGGGAAAASTGADMMPPTNNNNFGSPEVRAPDATRTMRLMDDGMGGIPMMPHPMLGMLEQVQAEMDMAAASSAFSRPVQPADARAAVNAAAQQEEEKENSGGDSGDDDEYVYDENDDDDDDDDVQVIGASGPTPPTLEDMFAPPRHLLHTAGGFQGARSVARDSRRWLLVNLQRDSEFSCHALNRDVWRDELVENLVREGFIFWQSMDTTADGHTYAERYSVMEYPHIAIIDPRTGRLMWRKEGWTQEKPLTAEAFAEIAMDFCSRHSFDKPPEAPRVSSSTNGSTGAAVAAAAAAAPSIPSESAATSRMKRPFMTEEEQIQAAMRASLKDTGSKDNDVDDVDSEMHDVDNDDGDDVQVVDNAKSEPETPSFVQELVSMEVGDEPSDGGARIQLRMPDGKRLVRIFRGDQTVKSIYAFVAQSDDEAKGGKEFVLKAGYPPRDLLLDMDNSIESCGLAGDSITVRWK